MTDVVPGFHREMYRDAQSPPQRLAVQSFRGSAKSFIFNLTKVLYEVYSGSANNILIVTDTGKYARDRLRMIRAEVESNEFLLADFGDIRGDRWEADDIELKRADGTIVKVSARGTGSQTRGPRPDLIICDDLENDEQVRSDVQRDALEDWFYKALLNSLTPDGKVIVAGTNLHPLCLLAKLMANPAWTVRNYTIETDGVPLWPERFSKAWIDQKRAIVGDLAFSSEFMGIPLINENPIFSRSWFRELDEYQRDKDFRAGVYTVLSCDPAISKDQSADYTALVSASATFAQDPNIYIKARRGHWTVQEAVSEIARMYREVGAHKLRLETVGYQKALKEALDIYLRDHREFMNIEEIQPDKDKERRAYAVQPLCQMGKIFIDSTDTGGRRLLEELTLFPTGDHDDLVDGFTDALAGIISWKDRTQGKESRGGAVLPKGSRINPITGVPTNSMARGDGW